MKKRVLSFLLIAAMLLTLLPAGLAEDLEEQTPAPVEAAEAVTDSPAEEPVTNEESLPAEEPAPADEPDGVVSYGECGDNLVWTLDETGTLMILGHGAMWNYGWDGKQWGDCRDSICSVIISDGVTRIGENAFRDCGNLASITIPESVSYIGSYAFYGCGSLTGIVIPSGVTVICEGTFTECMSLTNVTLPKGLKYIGDWAFPLCTSMSSLEIPEGVNYIGDWTFHHSGLTSLTLPRSVTYLGEGALSLCRNLNEIRFTGPAPEIEEDCFIGITATAYYPSSEPSWRKTMLQNYGGTIDWQPYEVDPDILANGKCGDELVWTLDKNGVLTISGQGAMWNYEWNAEQWGGYRDSIRSVVIEDGATTVGENAFRGCGNLTSAAIPESVSYIGSYAFYGCGSLTGIVIPSTVTVICEGTFSGCSSLTDVTLPKDLQCIDDWAFPGCGSLTDLEIPFGLSYIGDWTFQSSGLTDVTIPLTVRYLGEGAFSLCRSLENVHFKGEAPEIGENCFLDVTATVFYSCEEGCWTEADRKDYGGHLTWIASHTWEETWYEWSGDYSTVTAYHSCMFGTSHTESETVNTTSVVTGTPTCEEAGSITYTATFTIAGFETQTKTVALPALGHDWGEASYVWAEDLGSVTASHSCLRDAGHTESETVNTTSVVTTVPACEEDGLRTYTATFTIAGFETQTRTEAIPATGHAPGETVRENEVAAECETEGGYDEVVYCTVCGEELSREHTVIPALGHDWAEPSYEWSDDNSTVTAMRVCNNLPHHYEAEQVRTTSEVTTAPTCEEAGVRTYTAIFMNSAFAVQTRTEAIPALGHDWAEPSYEWSDDYSTVTAIRVCNNLPHHYEAEQVRTTSEVTTAATCEAEGVRTYTATFTNSAFAAQTRTRTIPALGHDWAEPDYVWSDDNSSVTATVICRNDPAHGITETAAATYEIITEPTIKAEGLGRFTAVFENDHFSTQTKDVVIDKLSYPALTEATNSATGVRLSWEAVAGAAQYQVLRKNLTKGESEWKLIDVTADCTTIDTNVSSASRYSYTVQAVDADGMVGPRDETGRTCTYIAKADITNLRYGVKGVSITWTQPAGAKNFRVMRREDGSTKWTVLAVVKGTSYTDDTAKLGTKYWYTVRGVSLDNTVVINSYNATGWSMRPLSAPVLTEAFNSATGVRVSWKPVIGAAKYRLLRKNLTKGETSWTAVGETADYTLIDKTAASASRYTYTVECVDSNGRTCSTSDSTGRTCTYIAMAKVTAIGGVANGIKIIWSQPAGAKNFRVFRKTANGEWQPIADVMGTSYLDTTAVKGVRYWYTVRAITLAGNMYINSYNATGWCATRK